MRDMIAYCGLDCEKCDAYLATINDDQALREKTAKLWSELNHAPILPEHINCQGCRVKIGIPAPSACSLGTTLPEFQPHFHALKPQCLIIGLAQPYCD